MERDSLDVDVLFVVQVRHRCRGAATSTAYRPGRKLKLSIAIIEKGHEVGSPLFQGAVMDIGSLTELLPDFKQRERHSNLSHRRGRFLSHSQHKINIPLSLRREESREIRCLTQ